MWKLTTFFFAFYYLATFIYPFSMFTFWRRVKRKRKNIYSDLRANARLQPSMDLLFGSFDYTKKIHSDRVDVRLESIRYTLSSRSFLKIRKIDIKFSLPFLSPFFSPYCYSRFRDTKKSSVTTTAKVS